MKKYCNFKNADGSWNFAEGPDENGLARIQCADCGRLYPSQNREPKAILPGQNIVGLGCNPLRRKARLSAAKAEAKKLSGCAESRINAAKAHQDGLLAELQAAILKAKDPELKALATAQLKHATGYAIHPEAWKSLQALAVKQTLADGRAAEQAGEHLDEPPPVG